MRYFHEQGRDGRPFYGELYICNRPVYSKCTLYRENGLGLAVIQQRYDPKTKRTWWTEIDRDLWDYLYLADGFYEFFKKWAGPAEYGLFPTVTIRQIMWALKLKPLKKERWETVFDHKDI